MSEPGFSLRSRDPIERMLYPSVCTVAAATGAGAPTRRRRAARANTGGAAAGEITPAPPMPAGMKMPRPGSSRAFVQNRIDRAIHFRIADVDAADIDGALALAKIGYLYPLANIFDLMETHPQIGGIVDQRVSGLRSIKIHFQPANKSRRAGQIAEETAIAAEDPSSSFWAFKHYATHARVRGGGLVEILWRHDTRPRRARNGAPEWSWAGFVPVPQQRLRYDLATGEACFAWTSTARLGVPVSLFYAGTFAVFDVDCQRMNFGQRGALRGCLPDWFGMTRVAGWSLQDLERWGIPPVDFSSDNEEERDGAAEAIAEMGTSGVLVHTSESQVKPLEAGHGKAASAAAPHLAWEDSRLRRITIRLLGAEQSVSISRSGEGSMQSVGGHLEIRDDIIAGDAELFSFVCRRDACVPLAVMNHGLDAAGDAALVVPELEELDVVAEVAKMEAQDEFGIEIAEDEAYANVNRKKPAKGTRTIRQARLERQAAEQGSNLAIFPGNPKASPDGTPPPGPTPSDARGRRARRRR